MKTLVLFIIATVISFPFATNLIFDFGASDRKTNDWMVLTDRVMGGLSRSTIEYTTNAMVVSGTISLENYGGFASVKTKFDNYDLSHYKGLKIRFKSTNQKFAFTLEQSKNWTYPYFKGDFSSKKENNWEEIVLYFNDFKTYQIGMPTGEKLPQAALKDIVRIGVMTTDKKEGPFTIEIDSIEFF